MMHWKCFGLLIKKQHMEEGLQLFHYYQQFCRVHGRKFNEMSIQESCDIGCKDSLAVFFRSASLITHSKKIKISNL